MSREDVRVELATAIDTVSGLKGHPRRPSTIGTGDAWPVWRGAERSAAHTYVDTFAVMISLPGDEAAADQWADERGSQVEAALEGLLYVTGIRPVIIATDAGDSFGLEIAGIREMD